MTYLFAVNAGIFLSVAVLHLLRVIYNMPMTVAEVSIAQWVSIAATVGIGLLAWLNWRATSQKSAKKNKNEFLVFLTTLLAVDAFILFYSYAYELSYWGMSGDSFLWIAIVELAVILGLLYRVKKGK